MKNAILTLHKLKHIPKRNTNSTRKMQMNAINNVTIQLLELKLEFKEL